MIIETMLTFIRSQKSKDIVLWRFHALRLTAWYWLSLWQSWSTLQIGEGFIKQCLQTWRRWRRQNCHNKLKRLFIISASLSFPDAGIMPKDPKTRVKVRQVKSFLLEKIFKSQHSYWPMFIILPLSSLWNYTNVLQLVLKRYLSWSAVGSSQFKTSASSRFLISKSIVIDCHDQYDIHITLWLIMISQHNNHITTGSEAQ